MSETQQKKPNPKLHQMTVDELVSRKRALEHKTKVTYVTNHQTKPQTIVYAVDHTRSKYYHHICAELLSRRKLVAA